MLATRKQMISDLEATALSNSGMTSLDDSVYKFPTWWEINDRNLSRLYSLISSDSMRVETLDAISSLIRDPEFSRSDFFVDMAAHYDRFWMEMHGKPYEDELRMPYCLVFLPWFKKNTPAGEQLTDEQVCVFLMMMQYVPGREMDEFHKDMLRFVRTRTISDAHRALQLREDGGATNLIQAESMLDTGNAPLAKGAL